MRRDAERSEAEERNCRHSRMLFEGIWNHGDLTVIDRLVTPEYARQDQLMPAHGIEAFRRFVALARAVRRPLVCHIRDAHEDAAALLRAEGAATTGGVIHCFTGGGEDARRYLDPAGLRCAVAGPAETAANLADAGCLPSAEWRFVD